MARQFQQAVGLPGEIVTVESLPFADPRPLHSDLDASRLRQAGFHPEPFSRVVQRLVAAIRPAPRPGGC
jgi:hypothetical protein